MSTANPSAAALAAEGLRTLKWNERVQRGDLVADGRHGFEPWEGPSGFRADTFIKTIYRRNNRRPANSVKSP